MKNLVCALLLVFFMFLFSLYIEKRYEDRKLKNVINNTQVTE